MSDQFSTDAHQDKKHLKLQAGQRLSRSRFVMLSELFRTGESSVYWSAQDRDEDCQVTLYFPPLAICNDDSLLEIFFQQLSELKDSSEDSWLQILILDPHSKPYPFIALSIGSSDSLGNHLLKHGLSSTWDDIEPSIEKVVQHAVQLHKEDHVHGRLSLDNIRFTEDDEVVFIGPQIDRIALQIIQGHIEKPIPESWDLHASPECLETGNCLKVDEIYALASVLLESIRHAGIHVKLPRHVELDGKVRFGNLLVPKSVKQALMNSLDPDAANRPNTAIRLSAMLGFNISEVVHVYDEPSLEILSPEGSERTRIFIRSLFQPKVIGVFTMMLLFVLGGWIIADWNQKKIIQEQAKVRQDLKESLALVVRDAEPSDINGVARQGSSTLIVRTSPAEALLSLSGPGIMDTKEEFSPAIWHQLQAGAFQLSVLAVGFAPTNVYPFLEIGQTNIVDIELSVPQTNVEFMTEPAGGTYRFQDAQGDWVTGVTPGNNSLPAGEYLVHFSLNGQNLTKPLHLKRYQSHGVKLIASFGDCSLKLNTYPENAEVYINAELRGMTPLTLNGLVPGEVKVEIRKPGYSTYNQTLVINAEKLNALSILLNKDSAISESN